MSQKRVVLLTDPVDAAPAVAAALAAVRGVPLIDTIRESKLSFGLLGDHGQEDIGALLAALQERNVPAAAVEETAVPTLTVVRESDKFDVEAEGFRCRLHAGTTPLIPWKAVSYLAAAVVKKTTITTTVTKEGPSPALKLAKVGLMLAGIPLPIGKTKKVERRREDTSVSAVLDLGLLKPAGRFRFNADHLDFTSLGDRRGYDSFGNFRLLVMAAAQHLPPIKINHGVKVFQSGKPLNTMGYETLQDLEREERWMLTRQALA